MVVTLWEFITWVGHTHTQARPLWGKKNYDTDLSKKKKTGTRTLVCSNRSLNVECEICQQDLKCARGLRQTGRKTNTERLLTLSIIIT